MKITPHSDPSGWLRQLFDVAIDTVRPAHCLPLALREMSLPPGRIIVLGAGKAAAEMALSLENALPEREISGLVVTRYGYAASCRRIEVVEAAHPIPDRAGMEAARRLLRLAEQARADDLVLCLLSGGGSALLALPATGVSLADKRAVTQALLDSGAPIDEINCVRKHLSAIKGGRLAAAVWPARLITLAISDVIDDDPATIASGPTVADPSTREQALSILAQRRIRAPQAVVQHLGLPSCETPKPGDPRFEHTIYRIIARAADAMAATVKAARSAGIETVLLGDAIQGEARDIAKAHAEIARQYRAAGKPVLLLSGGELTVTHQGKSGAGGRNMEYALALLLALDGAPGVQILACDTDGVDGQAGDGPEAAGALAGPDALRRARAAGLDAKEFLDRHDSYAFFKALDGLVVCGPTRTNVNDLRAILILPGSAQKERYAPQS